jgi:hypothetical protein
MSPTRLVRPLTSVRAAGFGWQLTSFMRCRIRFRVCSPMSEWFRKTFDTVTTDTLKSRAISFIVVAMDNHHASRPRARRRGATAHRRSTILSDCSLSAGPPRSPQACGSPSIGLGQVAFQPSGGNERCTKEELSRIQEDPGRNSPCPNLRIALFGLLYRLLYRYNRRLGEVISRVKV